jgi:Ser/Thr protein kinase RdoA (MazF antagonist)
MPDMPKVSDMAIDDEGLAAARRLATRWFPSGADVAALATHGFSGSPVVWVRPADGPAQVLKGFAEGTTRERAEWVHGIVDGLRRAGNHEIPAVREHAPGDTLVATRDGRLWEMVTYVDGASIDDPTPSQIASAMHALARIHTAAAALPHEPVRLAASRALAERVALVGALGDRPWRALLDSPSTCSRPIGSASTCLRWHAILRPYLAAACDALDAGPDAAASLSALVASSLRPLPCQVVLRDVWSEHVLFGARDPESVAGIIDPHAAGIDTPATDVARLLGSWIPLEHPIAASWWASALAAYETVRPLRDDERRLVPLLAASGILCGLENWFRWTLVESRSFSNECRVVSRIDRLVKTLPAALKVMIATMSHAGLTPENSSP